MAEAPLVYVYLSNALPSYAWDSIAIARRNFLGRIILLTDRPPARELKGVEVVDVQEWYEPEPFEAFSRSSPLDALFRGGFWLKAVERFYVLDQFMARFDIQRLFHAELDVLLLNLDGFSEALDEYGRGCFIPAQRSDRAVASMIYVNDAQSLRRLTEFFERHVELGNEMNMLGRFLMDYPDIAHAVPSETALDESLWPITPSHVPISSGAVDALGVGPWLLGYDPRNILGSTWNHFRESQDGPDFSALRFHADFLGRRLQVKTTNGQTIGLRGIHIHSKSFRRLRIPGVLALYAALANLRFPVPITLSSAGMRYRLLTVLLSRPSHAIIRTTPRWVARLMAPLVRGLVTTTPKILSERERRVVSILLPTKPFGSRALEASVPVVPDLELLEDSPLDWDRLLPNSPRSQRQELAREIGVFLTAIQSDTPAVFTTAEAPQPLGRQCYLAGRQLLFVATHKRYQDSKHAVTFWSDESLSNRWSFATPYQPINPDVVREMFPGGEADIFRWAKMGIFRPEPSLSAFQSYGSWLYSIRPRFVVLARL